MKKILSFALAVLMLASMLVITANAKDPFGTVVEIPYADKAPSMADALPDASWGTKLIHVDKNSKNAGITQYKPVGGVYGKVKQDLSFDVYGVWTNDTLYLCFTSPDPDFRGGLRYWWGDGFQITLFPGIADISYCNSATAGLTSKEEFQNTWDWCITFDLDDETPEPSILADGHSTIYGDSKTNTIVAKFAIPTTALGYKKGETFKENDYISFSMLRMDGSDADKGEAYVGWLEWGDFFNAKKGWDPNDKEVYVPTAENTKTTTANTFKLIKKGGSTTPTTPTTPKEQPSDWAKAEVDKAIAAGLVPDTLQQNYTKGISRANLSKILSKLLDKVYGKNPTKNSAKFTDTTDADVLKAANLEIINGYKQNDGSYQFKPNNTLKRAEMAAIVNRVAKLCGKTVTGYDKEVTFKDTANHWCKSELGWPVHTGIIKGTSATQFSPENTLTTEQTIIMIYRAYEALKK